MPITVAPASARARANCFWLSGKLGSRKITFTVASMLWGGCYGARDDGAMGSPMTNVVFVAPYALEATVRFVDAVAHVDGARVGLVSSDPVEAFPESVRQAIAGHWRTDD